MFQGILFHYNYFIDTQKNDSFFQYNPMGHKPCKLALSTFCKSHSFWSGFFVFFLIWFSVGAGWTFFFTISLH